MDSASAVRFLLATTPPPSWVKKLADDVGATGSILWVVFLVTAFGVATHLLRKEWQRAVLFIEPFSVPKELEEAGLTGSIFALRLSDQIIQLQRNSRLDDDPADIVFTDLSQFQVDLVLPGVGWSLRSSIRYLRQAFGRAEPRIVGEIVKKRSKYAIRLRSHTWRYADVDVLFNGMADADGALQASAEAALRLINPLEAASIFYVQEPRHSGYPKTLAALREYLVVTAADKHQQAYVIWATVHRAMGEFSLMEERLALARKVGHLGTRYYNFVGALCRERQQYREAQKNFETTLRLQPNNLSAMTNLGLLAHDEWRLSDAEEWFTKVVRDRPNSSRGYRGLGLVEMRRYRLEEALELFQRAMDVAPMSRWPRINKIQTYRLMGKFDLAKREIEAFTELEPDFPPFLRAWADLVRDGNDFARSLEINARAVTSDPHDPWVHEQRAELLRRLGRFPEARVSASKALELRPGFANALVVQAKCAFDDNLPDDALKLFEEAVRCAPQEPWIRATLTHECRRHALLPKAREALAAGLQLAGNSPDMLRAAGVVAEEDGDLDRALGLYRQAVLTAPHELWGRQAIVSLLIRRGCFDEALPDLEELENRWAASPEPCRLRGDLYQEKFQFDEAEAAYERAVALAKDLPDFYVPLADVLRRQRKLDQAEAMVNAALAIRPNFAAALRSSAEILRERKDYETSLLRFEAARLAAPWERRMQVGFADVLVRMGRLDEALEKLDSVLSDGEPPLGWALRVQGDAWARKDDKKQAVRSLELAIEAEPWNPWGEVQLARVMLSLPDRPAALGLLRRVLAVRPSFVPAQELLAELETREP